jgi:hypothetical protein
MLHTSFTKLTDCRVPLQLAPMPIVSSNSRRQSQDAGGLAMFSGLRASAAYLVDMLDQVANRTAHPSRRELRHPVSRQGNAESGGTARRGRGILLRRS